MNVFSPQRQNTHLTSESGSNFAIIHRRELWATKIVPFISRCTSRTTRLIHNTYVPFFNPDNQSWAKATVSMDFLEWSPKSWIQRQHSKYKPKHGCSSHCGFQKPENNFVCILEDDFGAEFVELCSQFPYFRIFSVQNYWLTCLRS